LYRFTPGTVDEFSVAVVHHDGRSALVLVVISALLDDEVNIAVADMASP
jgi:hypothetical protein